MVGGLVVNMIGGVVAGTRGGGLQLAQFLVGGGKKSIELGTGIVGWILSFPLIAIIVEQSSLEYQLICNADDLQQGVQGIPVRGILNGAFNLVY